LSDGRATDAYDWFSIRSWAGSQDRAFEELCYQLRDPAEPGCLTIKTAAPDGGVEWYDKAPDGRCHGHQVKYVHDVDRLMPLARDSLAAVGRNRLDRNVVHMTFWVPIDLPDPAHRIKGKRVEGARKRWEDAVARWKQDLPGVADIDIALVDSGQLLDRLNEPGNEGRQWFFFEQRALGLEWLREQLEITKSIAHDRYTPEHHVALPVASVLGGCAVTQRFVTRLRNAADTLAKALPDPPPLQQAVTPGMSDIDAEAFVELYTKLSLTLDRTAARAAALCSAAAGTGPAGMPAADMAETAAEVVADLYDARDVIRQVRPLRNSAVHTPDQADAAGVAIKLEPWTNAAADRLPRAVLAAEQLEALCRSDAARAAEAKVWVLLGEAGQGKTHLLVDATRRALGEDRPSVTIFGELLTAKNPLTQVAEQLGLGALSHAALLQAMDAAGSMCGARFTLIIDALNDSEEPGGWRTALPALVAEAAPYDHVALVVSCRSSLREAVLPEDMPGRGYPVTVHPGFAGHEVEALEEYLREAPSALPRTPMLTPSFSNPLFVKLYCDSLLSMPETGRRAAATPPHRSAVFDSFLDRRARQINTVLHLNPAERVVHQAVRELGRQMAVEGREVLSWERARDAVDGLAPQCTQWPKTLLGQLISQGVLATERYYPAVGSLETGIGFAYQAFSDDRIIHAVLDEHPAEVEAAATTGTLPAGSALRAWLGTASANLIDAATVLLPETTGYDLIDLLGPDATHAAGPSDMRRQTRTRGVLYRSLVHTLGLRSNNSVTERTVQLLNEASTDFDLGEEVLEAVLTVTTQPGHRLNADRLHRNLLGHSFAERDAWWGTNTYFVLDDSGALHRLLRWAEQLPTPAATRPSPVPATVLTVRRAGLAPAAETSTELQPADAEVVRLAATTLVWTLTSPNRFLRDRSTKALVQLLLGHPDVLTGLLERFLDRDAGQVDDPYLFERLVLVAHGVLVRTRADSTRPELLRAVAHQILISIYGTVSSAAHASRNALLCSAATRIVQAAHAAGLVSAADLHRTEHPHACPDVGDATDDATLETRYPSRDSDNERLWGSLRSSLTSLADFATYEVRAAVEHFSQLPLSTPAPPQDPGPVMIPEPAVQAFRDRLPDTVQDVLGSSQGVKRLLDNDRQAKRVLDDEQYRLLKACARTPTREEQLATTCVDKDWSCRWIMDSAVQRGWTPERFASFDNHNGHGHGRQGHKAERFGKKYAWLGLHELVERLANHRHMKNRPSSDFARYPGAGPLLLTDIDPTLPPAAHPLSDPAEEDDPGDEDRYATFAPAVLDGRWNPPAPALPSRDQITEWINDTDHLPDLAQLGIRNLDGTSWIVLNEYATDHASGRDWSGQAEQWHIQHSWLVADAYYRQVLGFLRDRSLMGRWMPEAPTRHGVYLSDLPLPEDDTERGYLHELRIVDYATVDDTTPHVPVRRAQTAHTSGVADADATAENAPAADPETPPTGDYMGLLAHLAARRSPPRPEDRIRDLHHLAARWAEPPSPPADEPEGRSAHLAYATDGTVLQAEPTVQEYSWSGSGHDCSLDAPAGLVLPCTRLLTGSGLRRDPDGGDWYTPDGTRVVRALHGSRPTGEVTTLLARRDWLQQRLDALGMRLVLGLFGERQPRTTDHLRQWREYSQTAGLEPSQPLNPNPRITRVRHNTDD
jgi:hypothetical protein